jgi:23S rRNA (guanosine2251-2'-O)-methyltransferase
MREREFDPRKGRPRSGPKSRSESRSESRTDHRHEHRQENRPAGAKSGRLERRPDPRQEGRDRERHPDRPPHRDKGRPEAAGQRPPRHGEARAERATPPEGKQPWRRDKPFRPDRPDRPDRPGFKPGRFANKGSRQKVWKPKARDPDAPVILYGWHSVKAALENPARRFHRLLLTDNAMHRVTESGLTLPIAPELVRQEAIEALVGPEAVHQGLLAEADPLDAGSIEDLEPQRLVLVLDQITDPHNVGAILRSASAFAVEAVITTVRHSPEMTGVLAKAASAALEDVPMIAVPNLARALQVLKDKNVFVVGLDSTGENDLATLPLRAPLALVVGGEGKGLRQLTRTTCDAVARLDLPGRIKSLNVSNATALALYVTSRRINDPA